MNKAATPHVDQERLESYLTFLSELSPDTEPETLRLAGQLHRVAHALYQLGESSLAEAGLSFSQYRLLMQLLFHERFRGRPALNPSEISDRQGLSRNTVSSLIRNLESEGLIARELDDNDRRRFLIRLTDAGRDVVKDHAIRHFGAIHACFSELTLTEQASMSGLLERMAENPVLSAGYHGKSPTKPAS